MCVCVCVCVCVSVCVALGQRKKADAESNTGGLDSVTLRASHQRVTGFVSSHREPSSSNGARYNHGSLLPRPVNKRTITRADVRREFNRPRYRAVHHTVDRKYPRR